MSTEILNAYLYRPIKSGKEYGKLIPKTNCDVEYPFSDRNTSEVMELMREISLKHFSQTKKLVQVLKGKNLENTVRNVYDFLHDHLQYKADGFEQDIRSPACSWNQRKMGVDCKSYSVFASSILLNLEIPHAFRKVMQPNSPDKWSHVYVIIPYRNKKLVIDATTHINKEVAFTKKYDMDVRLPARGLNGAAKQPQSEMTKAVLGFLVFLKELQDLGVSVRTTEAIKAKIRSLVERGVDPKINFTKEAIVIQGQEFSLISGLGSPQGLGFAGAAVTIATKLGALKAFGSKIGGLFTGIFGKKSSPSAFTQAAVNFVNTTVPEIQQRYQSDASALMTELSKSANFVLLGYQYARDNSGASRSKTGNDAALKIIKDFIASLHQIEKELSSDNTIEKRTASFTYPRNYIQRHYTSAPDRYLTHNYMEYKITPKSIVQNAIQTGKKYYNNVIGNTNENPQNQLAVRKSNTTKNIAIGAGLLTAAFLVVRLTPNKELLKNK